MSLTMSLKEELNMTFNVGLAALCITVLVAVAAYLTVALTLNLIGVVS